MDFGEVRSLVNTSDDDDRALAWPALLEAMKEALDERPSEVSDVWLPYVLQALERWPDRLRVAPRKWLNAIIRGEHVGVLMALVTAIDANRVSNPRFRAMCERRDFTWVRHLHFEGHDFKLATARALGASEAFTNLSSLAFVDSKLGIQKLRAIMGNPFAQNLVALTMSSCRIAGGDIASILRLVSFDGLERLDLSRNYLMDRPCFEALAGAALPSLRRLDLSGSWAPVEDLDVLLGASWIPQLDSLSLERSHMSMYLDGFHRVGAINIEALNIEQGIRERVLDSGLRPEVAAVTAETIQ